VIDAFEELIEIAEEAADIAGGVVGGALEAAGNIIPGLASGGYVTGPTLAMIGESGPEYVIPAAKMGSNISVVLNVSGTGDPERVAKMASQMIIRELNASNSDAMISSRV